MRRFWIVLATSVFVAAGISCPAGASAFSHPHAVVAKKPETKEAKKPAPPAKSAKPAKKVVAKKR